MALKVEEPTRPRIISFESITEELVKAKTLVLTDDETADRTAAHCEPFLPNKVLKSFLKEDNVKATLDDLLGTDNYDAELPEYVVKSAPRAFLTSIYMEANPKISLKPLQRECFTDKELPVKTRMRRPGIYDVYTIGSSEKLGYFSTWRAKPCEYYESNQWTFLAPTFVEDDFSYEFHQNLRLPFVYIPNPNPAGGYFGKVLKLGLRIDHQALTSFQMTPKAGESHVEVAVKFMNTDNNMANSDVKKFYDREKTTLELMRKLDDPHLIRAIATYTKGTSRCFIFPWAEGGNLATFWRRDRSGLDKHLVRWAIGQMAGITRGIMKLHAENTRHGDIKPLNILYFLDSTDNYGRGILKVADVGLAKVHAEYTKYRAATTTRMSSERYEPPEMLSYLHQKAAIPRIYDTWSLGCVFLEFIVWLIYGQSELSDLHRDLRDSLSDKFYETKGESHPRHQVVNKLIVRLEEKLPETSALGRLGRLISGHLLVPVDKRMDTKMLSDELDDIRQKCQRDSYCFGSDLSRLARVRPVPSDELENTPQPPDNYNSHTSRLDNRWQNIPDSEWARFLISRLDFPSLRPTIETGFCDACSSVDFVADVVDLGRTLHDLKKGSEDCSMCSFLYDRFLTASTGIVDQRQRFLSLSKNIPPAISFYVDPDYKGPTPHQARLGLPVLPKPGSPQEFALLNEWVALCDRTHDCMSREPSEESPGRIPTRLIDVGTADAPFLHLVETANKRITVNYVALSHCWGRLTKEERFCTYIDNIEDLKEHIPFEKLPQTFKDAVTATRALNVRYLWIDSLCIIQEDAEDWKVEAARMEDVFNSAYLTIAASSSRSSLQGFLTYRDKRAVIGINTEKGPLYLAENIDDFQKDVGRGILNTRGWVFQERALSRRTIHFTGTQVYWECGHGVHSETLAQLRNRESELLGDSKFPNYGLQKYKDDSIRLVQYLYRTYSGLNLTNTTDRSKALLGLEKRLGRTFQTRAEYGTLSTYFERFLLWQRDQPLPLDDIPYPEGEGTPSWSWMSLMGKISYLDIPFGKINWTGDVANPFNEYYGKDEVPWDGGLQVRAHRLAIREDSLKNRVRTDRTYSKMDLEDFICAVVGTSTLTNDDGTTDQYVLLLRHMSPPCMYERCGVGILLDIHIQPESFPVYVI